jgi:acetyl-CoA carboxylase biotin carboxylase subunit
MISKLAAWGRNRNEAIDRMRRALDEYSVGGIKTTLPFFREIVRDAEFIEGRLDTGFISRYFERRKAASAIATEPKETLFRDIALIASGLAFSRSKNRLSSQQPVQEQSKWRLAGRTELHDSRH